MSCRPNTSTYLLQEEKFALEPFDKVGVLGRLVLLLCEAHLGHVQLVLGRLQRLLQGPRPGLQLALLLQGQQVTVLQVRDLPAQLGRGTETTKCIL